MKSKDVYNLKKDEKINHDHYGICTVQNIIPYFGVVIIPDTEEGMTLLHLQSGAPKGVKHLETEFTLISSDKPDFKSVKV